MNDQQVTFDHGDPSDIAALFVGRRIVEAEMGVFPDAPQVGYEQAEGRLVLDDGTLLYLAGNEGGCSCGAGDYPLAKVAAVPNVITSARVENNPASDLDPDDGSYRIFVFADNTEINVAEFVGTDGNGYYGTGFALRVVRPGGAA